MYETTTKTKRNQFVISHLSTGVSLKEVQQLLIDGGFGKIDLTRVWKIWKRSDKFIGKRTKVMFCTFCLQNRELKTMYSLTKVGTNRVCGKVCDDCFNRRPDQPIKEDHAQ